MNLSKSGTAVSTAAVRRSLTLALALMTTLLTAGAKAEEPSTALINRDAIVYCAAVGKVYAVDKAHGAVVAVSAAGVSKSLKTGSDPVAIAVNNRTSAVYVVNGGDHSVSIIDGKTDTLVATVTTAARPYAIAVDEVGNKIYVSNIFSDELNVIDGVTNTVSSLKIGSYDAIVVDAPRRQIYLLGYEGDRLTLLNVDTNALEKIPAGATHLWGIALTANKLYVTHVQDSTIAAIDTGTHAVKNLQVGAMPSAVAANPLTGEVYVANYNDGSVTILNGDAPTAIVVGKHPQAIAIDATKKLVYVANTQDGTVSVIDAQTHHVLRTVSAGQHPYAIAVNAKTHTVYVANLSGTPFTALGND